MIISLILTLISITFFMLMYNLIKDVNTFSSRFWKAKFTTPKPGEIYLKHDFKPTTNPFEEQPTAELIYIVDYKDHYIQFKPFNLKLAGLTPDYIEHFEKEELNSRYLRSDKAFDKLYLFPNKVQVTRKQKLDII